MKRIIVHWNAGTYKANDISKSLYHFLIEGDGTVRTGIHKPEDNNNCKDNKYAAHVAGLNTGSIGVAYCGMGDFKNRRNSGDYPLTRKQCESGFRLIAELVKKYNIPVDQVKTHYEIGLAVKNGEIPKNDLTDKNIGKIDIIYLPPYPKIPQELIGDFIRGKVIWYLNKM